MGYQIRAVQGVEATVNGQPLQIPASVLRQIDLQQESRSTKEEGEQFYAAFTAKTDQGEFSWQVSFTLDDANSSINGVVLVSAPVGAEILSGPDFELVVVESE